MHTRMSIGYWHCSLSSFWVPFKGLSYVGAVSQAPIPQASKTKLWPSSAVSSQFPWKQAVKWRTGSNTVFIPLPPCTTENFHGEAIFSTVFFNVSTCVLGWDTRNSCLSISFCLLHSSHCCSVTQSCPTLCDPVHRSTPGFPVLHCLPELAQTHVLWISDAIQPSVIPFSSCPQSFPVLGSFPMSQPFPSGDRSIEASASVLPMNIHGWFP